MKNACYHIVCYRIQPGPRQDYAVRNAVIVHSTSRFTHQWLGHDKSDFALGKRGEVGKQALEDVLARAALGIHVDGHHGPGALLAMRVVHRRHRRLAVSRRGCQR